MNTKYKIILILISVLLLPFTFTHGSELTGRFSVFASAARATQGDAGYINKENTLSADQQSLRLMLDNAADKSEWSLHAKVARQYLTDIPFNDKHSSRLFRYDKLSFNWVDENTGNNKTRVGYEIDRLVYKQRFNKLSIAVGRQPVDFGSGRFWQPLNVFGAFAPTDLDTDYKPGIDAARFDWFPSDFSSLTAMYAFSPDDNAIEKNTNAALHYRSSVGEQSEYALLAASIIDYQVIGVSFESSWAGMGWRIEGTQYHDNKTQNESVFFITGIDYQLNNGTLITAEWYNNSRGAKTVTALTSLATDDLIQYGLQQHRVQDVLGFSASKEISPLLSGAYTLLASPLKDTDGKRTTSILHQLNFTYSLGNEADMLFSFQFANGRGLNAFTKPQSEFGHIPASLSVRLRYYF